MRAKRQEKRVLAYLKLYKTINPIDAWCDCGVYRLADVIYKLRRAGHNIITQPVIRHNRFGEQVRGVRYRLIN